jgi:hypothetical protein
MNRYGQMAQDQNRQHRPDAYSKIPDPDAFFAGAGETIATEVTQLRDQLLGPRRRQESLEDYRLRSYQALATAEELTLAEHHLFQPDPMTGTDEGPSDDPALDHQYQALADINQAINTSL